MGINFQKNALDLHMTFDNHNDLAFDFGHDFEGRGQGHHRITREIPSTFVL